jgi:hypothetical protein
MLAIASAKVGVTTTYEVPLPTWTEYAKVLDEKAGDRLPAEIVSAPRPALALSGVTLTVAEAVLEPTALVAVAEQL